VPVVQAVWLPDIAPTSFTGTPVASREQPDAHDQQDRAIATVNRTTPGLAPGVNLRIRCLGRGSRRQRNIEATHEQPHQHSRCR